jgi:hypothetical protein
LADWNGFLDDIGLVGDGIGTSSSSSESEFIRIACKRSLDGLSASAKMLRPVGALIAPFLLGDRESEAMDIGDGSAISISAGVPALCANIVCARPKGVRAVLLRALGCSGESSSDRLVRSVADEKSASPLELTDDNPISVGTEDAKSTGTAVLVEL